MSVTVAVVGGLGAMIGWGVADYFAKVSVDSVGELPSLIWGHGVGTAALGIGAAIDLGHLNHGRDSALDSRTVVLLVLFGVLQAVVYQLLYKGFAAGQVAVLSPTFASYSGIVAIVSIAFLGERAHLAKGAAIAGLFIGVILLSLAPTQERVRHLFATPGFRPVLGAAILAASWTLGWGHLVSGRAPLSCAFIMYAAMTLVFVVMAAAKKQGMRVPLGRGSLDVVAIGLGEACAYSALSWAFSRSDLVGVITLISGAAPLPTVLLARLFLRERLTRTAWCGVTCVVVCTALLAVTR